MDKGPCSDKWKKGGHCFVTNLQTINMFDAKIEINFAWHKSNMWFINWKRTTILTSFFFYAFWCFTDGIPSIIAQTNLLRETSGICMIASLGLCKKRYTYAKHLYAATRYVYPAVCGSMKRRCLMVRWTAIWEFILMKQFAQNKSNLIIWCKQITGKVTQ